MARSCHISSHEGANLGFFPTSQIWEWLFLLKKCYGHFSWVGFNGLKATEIVRTDN